MKKHLKLTKTCIVKHRRISHEAKKVLDWPASCSRRSGQTNTFRHPERQESVLRNDPSTPFRILHPKTAKKAPKRYVVVSIWIDLGQNPGPATHRDLIKKYVLEQILMSLMYILFHVRFGINSDLTSITLSSTTNLLFPL